MEQFLPITSSFMILIYFSSEEYYKDLLRRDLVDKVDNERSRVDNMAKSMGHSVLHLSSNH